MKKIYRYLRKLIIFFFVSSIVATLLYRRFPVPFTPLMGIRCLQHIFAGESPRLWHKWIPLDDMSKHLPVAVMASEDQNFLIHNGFDFRAIEQSFREQQRGRRRRGGSTISQQTAKNVFLWPTSSWLRKGFEVYFTFLIETFWSKERIMEVYLNSIEMGDGIYGAEAVAQRNFACPARQLTRAECALVAATLPNPRRYDSARPNPFMRKRQSWILRQMRHIPPFPKQ